MVQQAHQETEHELDPGGYLLLMRHARHRAGNLTAQGKEDLLSVASVLAETLAEQRINLEQIVWTVAGMQKSEEARDTAAFLRVAVWDRARLSRFPQFFRVKGIEMLEAPLPGAYEHMDGLETARDRLKAVKEMVTVRKEAQKIEGITQAPGGRSAVLLVGNDPGISWLAADLVGRPVPMKQGEVVCLRLRQLSSWRLVPPLIQRRRANLLWTISPSDEEAAIQLEAKIKSKMDVAKVLGSVVIAVFTFLLQEFFQNGHRSAPWLVSLYILASAGALYFSTLSFYDRLLMPRRFWGQRLPRARLLRRLPGNSAQPHWLVSRPPSSAAWVLYQNMVRTWRSLFLPATFLVAAGLILLAADALSSSAQAPATRAGGGGVAGTPETVATWDLWPWPTLGLVLTIAVVSGWVYHFRPRLGVQD